MTTDQMFDRLRELRPTAGTEGFRTILNCAGGDFNAALASLGAATPAAPPTNQATVRTVEQVRADRLLGVESARRPSGRRRAPGRRTCARRICAWRSASTSCRHSRSTTTLPTWREWPRPRQTRRCRPRS